MHKYNIFFISFCWLFLIGCSNQEKDIEKLLSDRPKNVIYGDTPEFIDWLGFKGYDLNEGKTSPLTFVIKFKKENIKYYIFMQYPTTKQKQLVKKYFEMPEKPEKRFKVIYSGFLQKIESTSKTYYDDLSALCRAYNMRMYIEDNELIFETSGE